MYGCNSSRKARKNYTRSDDSFIAVAVLFSLMMLMIVNIRDADVSVLRFGKNGALKLSEGGTRNF